MTHRLTNNYAKNYCNRTLIVKVIVGNVVTCFFGTRCMSLGITFIRLTTQIQYVNTPNDQDLPYCCVDICLCFFLQSSHTYDTSASTN